MSREGGRQGGRDGGREGGRESGREGGSGEGRNVSNGWRNIFKKHTSGQVGLMERCKFENICILVQIKHKIGSLSQSHRAGYRALQVATRVVS